MRSFRPRMSIPSPAMILASAALFAALGGGAYAATSTSSATLAFHNATTMNGWTLYGAASAPAGYAKEPNGVVHLRGAIKGGASGDAAFVLPLGYRPQHILILPIDTNGGTLGTVTIKPNGQVEPIGTGVSGYSGLDGISFVAGE